MIKVRGVLRWARRWLPRLAVWAAAVGAAAYLAGGWYLPAMVERALSRQFPDTAVSVEGARFSGIGVLLRGVSIAADRGALKDSPIFFAERVRAGFSPNALLGGRISVTSAALRDAVLTADFEKGKGWTVQSLLGRGSGEGAATLPLVRIEQGALRLRRVVDGKPQSITTVGLNGQIASVGTGGTYGFSLRADERFALSGSRVEGMLQLGRPGQPHRLTLTGQLRMPRTQILDNTWNLDAVEMDCAFDAAGVDVTALRFRMGEGVGQVSGKADFSREGGFAVDADLTGFTLSDTPAADTVVYGKTAMEFLGSWATKFLRRYQPRGQGDVHLQVAGRWDALAQAEIHGQVICQDISVRDERFPYRLEKMRGTIDFQGRSLTLNALQCEHNGSDFVIEGSIESFGPSQSIRLRVVSGLIRFDEDVYRALGPEAKRLWFAFMPSGTGAIDYMYRRSSDGVRTRRLGVDLLDAGVMYEHFPYPLEHLTGRVLFEPNLTTLSEVSASYDDGQRILLSGTAAGPNDFDIRITGQRIPVDPALIGALPRAQQELLAQMEIEGRVDVTAEVFADPTGQRPFDYTSHLEVTGRRFQSAAFAVPLEDVRIVADVTPGTVGLRELSGRRGHGQVMLRGQIAAAGADGQTPGLCIDVTGKAFELDEAFWSVADSVITGLPKGLRLSGPVDAEGRWVRNMPADDCGPTTMTVVCRDNPILVNTEASGRATGTLRVEAGQVWLEGFGVSGLVLSDALAGVMPIRMRQAYERMNPAGRVDVDLWQAAVRADGLEASGRLTLDGVRCAGSDFLEDLSGTIEGRFRVGPDAGVEAVEAFYRMEDFQIRGRTVDQLSGQLVYDPNTGAMDSPGFIATVGDGSASGTATVSIQSGESFLFYTLEMGFDRIDVDRIVSTGQAAENAEAAQRGKVEGTMTLQGRIGQSETQQGRLNATVSGMQLGRQSLIGKVLTAIQFREPKQYVFSRLELDAFVSGDEVIVDRVRIVGRPFVFHGDGRVNLRTQRIAMDLVALGGLAGTEPIILDSLLRGLGSALWKIEIRGLLPEPEIKTVSLPILQVPLELFKQ